MGTHVVTAAYAGDSNFSSGTGSLPGGQQVNGIPGDVNLDRAVTEFNATLARDPSHEPTLHNMTLVYIQTGKFSEAEAALARLEKASPQNDKLPMLRERLREARGAGGNKAPGETSARGAAGARKRTPSD